MPRVVVPPYSIGLTARTSPPPPPPPVSLPPRAPSIKRLPLPHHEVLLTGVGRDVPVYVERPLIDFKCCMLGHLYRDVLVVSGGKAEDIKGRLWEPRGDDWITTVSRWEQNCRDGAGEGQQRERSREEDLIEG